MYYAKFVRFFGGIGTHPQNENWKMADFLLKTGLFRTLPPFSSLLMGENGHFFNFHFEDGYHRMSKNCTNFAYYNSERTNDAPFLKTNSAFVALSVRAPETAKVALFT